MNTKTSSLPSAAIGMATKTPSRTTVAPRKFARQLPVRRIWPTWVIASVQAGILVTFVALWEVAARRLA